MEDLSEELAEAYKKVRQMKLEYSCEKHNDFRKLVRLSRMTNEDGSFLYSCSEVIDKVEKGV